MALELLAIDLGKRSFHLYGIDTNGEILSRKVSRTKLAEVVNNLPTHGFDQPYARPPCRIWGRVAARPVALHCAGTGRRRRCRVVRPSAIDLRTN